MRRRRWARSDRGLCRRARRDAHVWAVTVVAEVGRAYVPAKTPVESAPDRGISLKTGNAHLRRQVVVAVAYRHRMTVGKQWKQASACQEEIERSLGKRNNGCISAIESCWPRVRAKSVVMTAVGSELLGFIWAIGIQAETAQKEGWGGGGLESICSEAETLGGSVGSGRGVHGNRESSKALRMVVFGPNPRL